MLINVKRKITNKDAIMYKFLLPTAFVLTKATEINVDCNFLSTDPTEEEKSKCLQEYLCKLNASPNDGACNPNAVTLESGMTITPRGSMSVTTDYGCWCRHRSNFQSAKGYPVDDLDRTCRNYVFGLQCIQMDYPSCDVANLDWSSKVVASFVSGNLFLSCEDSVQDCAYAVCETELHAFEQQGLEIKSPLNMHPNFDPEFQCLAIDNGLGPVVKDQCCGTYPERYPYSSMGNLDQSGQIPARECCSAAGKTFNPLLQSCCADGTIKTSCS